MLDTTSKISTQPEFYNERKGISAHLSLYTPVKADVGLMQQHSGCSAVVLSSENKNHGQTLQSRGGSEEEEEVHRLCWRIPVPTVVSTNVQH